MLNPFDTQRASFDEPIDMLYACHSKVRRFCTQIAQLSDYLNQHGCTDVALNSIQQIHRYFTQAAPLHHQDEEQDFFPLLLRHAPHAQPTITQLYQQHNGLHDAWQAVANEFTHIQNQPLYRPNAAVLAHFVDAYAAHLALEEPLFVLGKQCIPAAQLSEIGTKMAQRRRMK